MTKNAKNVKECFFTKLQKTKNVNICILCHNLWTNQILDLLSIPKTVWTSVLWKIHIQLAKKWPEMVVKLAIVIVIRFDSEYNKYFDHALLSVKYFWTSSKRLTNYKNEFQLYYARHVLYMIKVRGDFLISLSGLCSHHVRSFTEPK